MTTKCLICQEAIQGNRFLRRRTCGNAECMKAWDRLTSRERYYGYTRNEVAQRLVAGEIEPTEAAG